jgi:hypothetical protein
VQVETTRMPPMKAAKGSNLLGTCPPPMKMVPGTGIEPARDIIPLDP